jgi:glycosyltransferase involved in cell wall biosynthesis
MKLAFVLTQDRGGPVDLTVALARELDGRPGGPEIRIFGPPPVTSAGDASDLLEYVHVTRKSDVVGGWRLRTLLREWQPDMVHAQDRRAGLVCAGEARIGAPVVQTYHGVPDSTSEEILRRGAMTERAYPGPQSARMASLVLAADAVVARAVKTTICPSHAIAGFLTRVCRVPTEHMTVIHNGVHTIPSRPPDGPAVVFISVCSFARRKAMPDLVRAFAAVSEARPQLRLVLVGDGEDRAVCEQVVAAHDIAARVDFLGYRRDVPVHLAAADAFVLPSTLENLPLALLEAMSAGKACVAADVGGVREVLDSECGILIGPADQPALEAALVRLADSPDLAAALGRNAARRMREEFTIEACADAHLEVYRKYAAVGSTR